MTTVCPRTLPPLIRWPGGKTRMAKRLVKMFPPHDTYVEPFAGGASVFFHKPLVAKNVIADADPWVIDLYRKVSRGALAQCDGGIKVSKGLFIRAKKNRKACYKVALSTLSYHGDRATYGAKSLDGKITLANKLAKAECYAGKLRRARLRRGDFAKVMSDNDSCNTVHFLDPPWPMDYSDKYHAHGGPEKGKSQRKGSFGKAMDPQHVFNVSNRMKGTVVVIYNWTPRLAKVFSKKGWTVKKINATTQHGRGGLVSRPNLVAIKRSRCGRRRGRSAA